MSPETVEPHVLRRESILQAAIGVFLRYGYKKTSMDDLARAAEISRQGLYLHFATKEVFFKECVFYFINRSRVTMRAALARDHLTIEDRLLGAFVALKSHCAESEVSLEHMNELFATAVQLVGPLLDEFDQSVMVDLTRVLQSSGVAAKWKNAGITAKDLAQHLYAASHGIEHYAKNAADYSERMRVAIRLVCRAHG